MGDQFPGVILQRTPLVIVAILPGNWLLERATPMWRISDPHRGFQRMVNEKRARKIAATVLDDNRTFPNAIVLATDEKKFEVARGRVQMPGSLRLLVVDGQHRLYAQQFSEIVVDYCCVIHSGLQEVDMARLFVEINDTQTRVPSSLRWDLVRLVRDGDNPERARAADLLYDLSEDEKSPLFQRLDRTGEQKQLTLKQGSLAPEVRRLLSQRASPLVNAGYAQQYELLKSFFVSMRECDADGWDNADSNLYTNRVLRALLRLFLDILRHWTEEEGRQLEHLGPSEIYGYLSLIKVESLERSNLVERQGSAGIKSIYDLVHDQVFER